MNHFVHVDMPLQHPGITRIERAVETLRHVHLPSLLLAVLAGIGRPVVLLGEAVQAGLAARREARRIARSDAMYWSVAQSDARVMADISRAMADAAHNGAHL